MCCTVSRLRHIANINFTNKIMENNLKMKNVLFLIKFTLIVYVELKASVPYQMINRNKF